MKRAFAIALAVALVGCPPPAPPPTPEPPGEPDDVPAPTLCAHLAELECKEGVAPNCVRAVEKSRVWKLADFNSRCLAGATTKEAARLCRSVECP